MSFKFNQIICLIILTFISTTLFAAPPGFSKSNKYPRGLENKQPSGWTKGKKKGWYKNKNLKNKNLKNKNFIDENQYNINKIKRYN